MKLNYTQRLQRVVGITTKNKIILEEFKSFCYINIIKKKLQIILKIKNIKLNQQ